MLYGGCNVITSEFVAIGLYIGNTGDFQIGFELRELESEYFIIACAIDRLKVSFYSIKVTCV